MSDREQPGHPKAITPVGGHSDDKFSPAGHHISAGSSPAATPDPPPLSAFKAVLARHDHERRKVRVEKNLDQLAEALETVDLESENVNVVAVLRSILKLWRRLVPNHVLGELDEEVGELAEESQARLSWLYVSRGDRLEALLTHGYVGGRGRDLSLDGPGIVPLVARSGEAYCVGDVAGGRDPYYVAQTDETRSEQAVPIFFQNRLLGVLNQESPYPGTFSPAKAKALEQRSIRLVRHLLALEAQAPDGEMSPCSWNPDLHGWDFRSFLDIVITHLKRELGRAGGAMHLTVWYANPMSKAVFALATTGYGKASLRKRTMDLERSFTGMLALKPDGTVEDCRVHDPRMFLPEVDRMMGLTMVRAVTIQSCGNPSQGNGAKQPGMVLSFYVFDEEAERSLPDENQLREMAELLQAQFAAYLRLRPRLAAAQIEQTLQECPDTSEQFPAVAAAMARVFDVQAMTILALPEGSESLHVVAATTPLEFNPPRDPAPGAPPPRERSLMESPYKVGDRTYTGTSALKPGVPVLQNAPGISNTLPENTLPEGWPDRASLKMREHLPKVVGTFRRSIGYGVDDRAGSRALGVFRGIRSSDARPFTLCDLTALRDVAEVCADDFRSWQDWFAQASRSQGSATMRDRLNLPIPRSRNRPVHALAREVLVDVLDLVRERLGDSVLQATVLTEHLGSVSDSAQVFAYYSELARTAPRSDSRLSPDKPRLGESTWEDLLDRGTPVTFRLSPSGEQDAEVLAGARVPFWSWCGRHIQRGVLTADLTQPREFGPDLIADLHTAARKLAAILAAAGSFAARAQPIAGADPQTFVRQVRASLGASSLWLRLAPGEGSETSWSDGHPLPPEVTEPADDDSSPWVIPMIVSPRDGATAVDPDAERWGVFECRIERAELLRVPLRLGAETVGVIIAAWDIEPDASGEADSRTSDDLELLQAHRIRDLIALWTIWTWSPQEPWPFQINFHRDETQGGKVEWRAEIQLPSKRHDLVSPEQMAMEESWVG